jgi:hypothetical protein
MSRATLAVENDYNLLVSNLNDLAEVVNDLRDETERRRLREAREGLKPNETNWVNRLALRLPFASGTASQLQAGAVKVLRSMPGEAVFDAQPPSAPDTL